MCHLRVTFPALLLSVLEILIAAGLFTRTWYIHKVQMTNTAFPLLCEDSCVQFTLISSIYLLVLYTQDLVPLDKIL